MEQVQELRQPGVGQGVLESRWRVIEPTGWAANILGSLGAIPFS